MSEMKMYIGTFEKSDLPIEPEDNDDFYNLEKKHKCNFVKVSGQLYKVTSTHEVDSYGFEAVLLPSDKPTIICYWYNGGAGIHEVIHDTIKRHLESNP